VIDAPGQTLLPGLIDAHVHSANSSQTLDFSAKREIVRVRNR
jgi:imidazolonepropionase-like amidohydrolase